MEMKTMSFSFALIKLKAGKCVARLGWNGKGMFLYLVEGSRFAVNREPLNEILGEGTMVSYNPHIDMKTADGTCVPWLCSQTDMLAEDWVEVVISRNGDLFNATPAELDAAIEALDDMGTPPIG